jgi:hypothetical protein
MDIVGVTYKENLVTGQRFRSSTERRLTRLRICQVQVTS